jgi:hypothetical protein
MYFTAFCFGLFFRELNEETGLQLNNILERQDQSLVVLNSHLFELA